MTKEINFLLSDTDALRNSLKKKCGNPSAIDYIHNRLCVSKLHVLCNYNTYAWNSLKNLDLRITSLKLLWRHVKLRA